MGFVAVGTADARMGAVLVVTGTRVLFVKGREVRPGALVACREACFADVSSVAPLEARGTLPRGR